MGRIVRLVAVSALVPLAVVVGGAPASAGGGCHRSFEQGPTEGTGTTVEMSKACMNPTVLRVDAGTTVTFVNRDTFLHNLFGIGGFGAGDLLPEVAASVRFDSNGTYPYACTLHPGMVGAVVVGDGSGTGVPVNVGADLPTKAPVPEPTVVPQPASATRSVPTSSSAAGSDPILTVGILAVLCIVGGYFGRRTVRASRTKV